MSPLKKTVYAAVAVALAAFPTTVTAAVAKDKDKDKDKTEAPGQAKKAEETGGAPFVPPGQAKKAEPTDTGAPSEPPGQAKKHAPSASGTSGDANGDDGTAPADSAAPVIAPEAPPKLGRSVGVEPVTGTVRVRGAKGGAYVPLSASASIPSGAIVDARKGTLVLRTAVDRSGRTQSIELEGAIFQVRQPKRGRGMTEFVLRGGRPEGCPRRGGDNARIASAPRKRQKKSSRGLWAKDRNGRFRTRGRNSVATVRGTRWLTRETCAGTLTRVTEGAVAVRDLRRGKIVLVRAGKSYLARTGG